MLTVTNAKTNKKYEITEEMEQCIKSTQIQINALADGLGVDVAITNAYCMNLALSNFLNDVMSQNDGKTIEELLRLREIGQDK